MMQGNGILRTTQRYGLALAGGLTVLAIAPGAMAGFTAHTGTDSVTLTDVGAANAPIGNMLSVEHGTFGLYTADTPDDPQITTDLYRYGYTLSGTVTGYNATSNTLTYSGDYEILYDADSNGSWDASDYRISSGTANLNVIPFVGGLEVVTGSLTQQFGPQLPLYFADLSYGGSLVVTAGVISTVDNTINLTLRQNATAPTTPAPEPGALAVLTIGGWALLRRNR